MSKELETLEIIRQNLTFVNHENEIINDYEEECNIIEQALQRLEAIDNANPSEAMEKLEKIGHLTLYEGYNDLQVNEVEEFSFVKQALLKTQEQEKVLEILIDKEVNMLSLKFAIRKNSLELYNNLIPDTFKYLQLTKEEFELLKRWLNCQKN